MVGLIGGFVLVAVLAWANPEHFHPDNNYRPVPVIKVPAGTFK